MINVLFNWSDPKRRGSYTYGHHKFLKWSNNQHFLSFLDELMIDSGTSHAGQLG